MVKHENKIIVILSTSVKGRFLKVENIINTNQHIIDNKLTTILLFFV